MIKIEQLGIIQVLEKKKNDFELVGLSQTWSFLAIKISGSVISLWASTAELVLSLPTRDGIYCKLRS